MNSLKIGDAVVLTPSRNATKLSDKSSMKGDLWPLPFNGFISHSPYKLLPKFEANCKVLLSGSSKNNPEFSTLRPDLNSDRKPFKSCDGIEKLDNSFSGAENLGLQIVTEPEVC